MAKLPTRSDAVSSALAALQKEERRRAKADLLDLSSLSYCDFLTELGLTLDPGQRAICLVAYDGHDPIDLDGEEKELAKGIFGGVDRFRPEHRRVFAAVCGARAGKTYILTALRLLWGAVRRDLSVLAPGELAFGHIVAPSVNLARQTLRYVKGATEDRRFKPFRISLADSVRLKRPDGRSVSVNVTAASGKGAGGRGVWMTDAALDECAFFRGEEHVVSDYEVYNAITARVLPGGQIILPSTPWAEDGLLYDVYKANFGHPVTAMVAHAPSLILQNKPHLRQVIDAQRHIDPENARREYDAEFMAAGSDRFFSDDLIKKCTEGYDPRPTQPGDQFMAGADLGFTSDSSSLCVTRLQPGGLREVMEVAEVQPRPGEPLVPSVILGEFSRTCSQFGVQAVVGDRHYKETALEFFGQQHVGFVDAPRTPAEAYIKARSLMRQGLVKIPENAKLLKQLREVEGRRSTGGVLTIYKPRVKVGLNVLGGSGHGDVVDAFILSLWLGGGDEVKAPEAQYGSAEWEAEQMERRAEKFRRQSERKWWDSRKGT